MMRAARHRIEDIAAKRAELDKEVDSANEAILQAELDAANASERLSKVEKIEQPLHYNRIVGEMNAAKLRKPRPSNTAIRVRARSKISRSLHRLHYLHPGRFRQNGSNR